MASVAPGYESLMQRVTELAEPLRPARRGQLVQNRRGQPQMHGLLSFADSTRLTAQGGQRLLP